MLKLAPCTLSYYGLAAALVNAACKSPRLHDMHSHKFPIDLVYVLMWVDADHGREASLHVLRGCSALWQVSETGSIHHSRTLCHFSAAGDGEAACYLQHDLRQSC